MNPMQVETPRKSKDVYFQIDWFDFKTILQDLILRDKSPKFKRSDNERYFRDLVTRTGSWNGVTRGQLERWITEGYVPPKKMQGLADLIPPIREKRKFIRMEDGD